MLFDNTTVWICIEVCSVCGEGLCNSGKITALGRRDAEAIGYFGSQFVPAR